MQINLGWASKELGDLAGAISSFEAAPRATAGCISLVERALPMPLTCMRTLWKMGKAHQHVPHCMDHKIRRVYGGETRQGNQQHRARDGCLITGAQGGQGSIPHRSSAHRHWVVVRALGRCLARRLARPPPQPEPDVPQGLVTWRGWAFWGSMATLE